MVAYSKTTSSQSTASTGFKQALRQVISETLNSHFSGTLGKEPDIVNIVMALCYRESSFRPNLPGPVLPLANSSIARDYWNSPVIVSARGTANAQQLANINEGLRAWGVMQVGGWNVVRGASKAGGGKTEIEKARPDLAPQLMVGPGESIRSRYDGEANLRTQVLAGLVMLESKYKLVRGSGINWQIGRFTFNSRISGAVAAYLGLGARDVVTGITPQQYANSIVYGQAYQIANNGASPSGYQYAANPSAQQTSSGPIITAASGNNQVPAGC